MQALDARAARNKHQPPGLTAKKVRKEGQPSGSLAPYDAPSWAVRNTTGQYKNRTNIKIDFETHFQKLLFLNIL